MSTLEKLVRRVEEVEKEKKKHQKKKNKLHHIHTNVKNYFKVLAVDWQKEKPKKNTLKNFFHYF